MSPRTASLAITATGLRIGIAYIPPAPAMTRTDELVQAALLEPRTAQPMSLLQSVLGAIWRWL